MKNKRKDEKQRKTKRQAKKERIWENQILDQNALQKRKQNDLSFVKGFYLNFQPDVGKKQRAHPNPHTNTSSPDLMGQNSENTGNTNEVCDSSMKVN